MGGSGVSLGFPKDDSSERYSVMSNWEEILKKTQEHAGTTTSQLAWECLGFLQDNQEKGTWPKKVWMFLLTLLPPPLNYREYNRR